MTYTLIIPPIAQRQLRELDKSIQERILTSLERIRIRPYDFVKKITGTPFYKVRIGDYRVILDIQNEQLTIFVIKVGHRKNIYKQL